MKKLFIILLGFLCFQQSFSQDEPEVIKVRKATIEEPIINIVEEMPSFPGGDSALFSFLARQIVYPDSLKAKGVQGKVYCEFIIEKDGSITNEKIIRSQHPAFDPTILNTMRNMPKWNPGMQLGKPVRVKMVLPFNFTAR